MKYSIRDILNKAKSGTAEELQKEDFLTLFHQAEIESEIKNNLLEDLNQTEVHLKNKQFFDGLFESFWRKRKLDLLKSQSKSQNFIRLAQLAAILVVGLLLGYVISQSNRTSEPVFYTSVAPRGSVAEMYLPDGSHIYLNSGSEIKYSVNGTDGMREVFLKGEAWFQVAKIPEKPFLVHTSFYDVRVTGTSFNVKAYPEEKEVTTTLEEGSVHVVSSGNLKLAEESVLKPGEQLVYNKESKNIQIADVNTKWYTSWKDNKLVFINMSLKDLRILLERKYGVEIEIDDPNILKYHYDGTLKDETILEVMGMLQHTLPIQYQIVGQKILIQKK